MTIDQGSGQTAAVVRIRIPRYTLVQDLVLAGLLFVVAVSGLTSGDQQGPRYAFLASMGVIVAESLWALTWGVDLTPESVILRGFRRRSIPWQQVQAVVRYEMLGSRMVRLIPQEGKPVTLRAPTSMLGLRRAVYERDFRGPDIDVVVKSPTTG